MKTKLLTIVLFMLVFIITINAQTTKPKQTVKKANTQIVKPKQTVKKTTAQKQQTKTAVATKPVILNVEITTVEEYDEYSDEFYDIYYLTDKETGKTIKELSYNNAYSFSDGLAAVQNYSYKWGFIDQTGKEVIPPKYEYVGCFNEDLACVKLSGKYGFVNKKGIEIIPCKYDTAENFSNGKAQVTLNGETFYIDKTGKKIK